jgi:hypothetical protein
LGWLYYLVVSLSIKMSYYGTNLGLGLATEKRLKRYWASLGIEVTSSTSQENIWDDIDCYITLGNEYVNIGIEPGTHAVSIKREDAGAMYKNVYFELYQLEKPVDEYDNRSEDERWLRNGWWFQGKAPIYAIVQYQKLRVFSKLQILEYLRQHDWLRKRRLTEERRIAMVNSSYRYEDAICGFLSTDKVPHLLFELPKDEA